MEETRYMISDASKLVGVEAHVLRYWQEQLGITVPRNEMGHRYYTQEHIEIFKNVKQLKDRGFGLRAIKSIQAMPEEMENSGSADGTEAAGGEAEALTGLLPEQMTEEKTISLAEQQNEGMLQFRAIMGEIVLKAMEDNNRKLGEEIGKQLVKEELEKRLGETVSERVSQQIGEMLRTREAAEEARYRQLDETIRRVQKNRAEAAASAAAQAPKPRLYTVAEDGRFVPDIQESQRGQKTGKAAKEIRSVSQLKKEQKLLQKKQREMQRLKKKQEQKLLREQKKNTNKRNDKKTAERTMSEAAAAQAPQQTVAAAEKQKVRTQTKKRSGKGLFSRKERK